MNIGAKGSDKDLIKELNYRLKEDPNTELPLGFQRVKEQEFTPVHSMPSLVRIHPTIKMAVEILDDVF